MGGIIAADTEIRGREPLTVHGTAHAEGGGRRYDIKPSLSPIKRVPYEGTGVSANVRARVCSSRRFGRNSLGWGKLGDGWRCTVGAGGRAEYKGRSDAADARRKLPPCAASIFRKTGLILSQGSACRVGRQRARWLVRRPANRRRIQDAYNSLY